MADTSGNLQERDINGHAFAVGDYVNVRCLVASITPSPANGLGGAADSINCTAETPGNIGEFHNVNFSVSPTQCRKAGNSSQA